MIVKTLKSLEEQAHKDEGALYALLLLVNNNYDPFSVEDSQSNIKHDLIKVVIEIYFVERPPRKYDEFIERFYDSYNRTIQRQYLEREIKVWYENIQNDEMGQKLYKIIKIDDKKYYRCTTENVESDFKRKARYFYIYLHAKMLFDGNHCIYSVTLGKTYRISYDIDAFYHIVNGHFSKDAKFVDLKKDFYNGFFHPLVFHKQVFNILIKLYQSQLINGYEDRISFQIYSTVFDLYLKKPSGKGNDGRMIRKIDNMFPGSNKDLSKRILVPLEYGFSFLK